MNNKNNGYEASKHKLLAHSKRLKEDAITRFEDLNLVCKECGEPIPYEKRKGKPKFCSRSCSTKHNNRLRPKKVKPKKKRIVTDWSLKTKGMLKENASSYQSWRTQIRKHSAQVMNSHNIEYECKHCGYTLHNEICHIHDVSDFDDSATLGEINDINNLIYLCPTHHWEFDNGYLEI